MYAALQPSRWRALATRRCPSVPVGRWRECQTSKLPCPPRRQTSLHVRPGCSQYDIRDVSYGILLSVSLLGLSACTDLSKSAINSC